MPQEPNTTNSTPLDRAAVEESTIANSMPLSNHDDLKATVVADECDEALDDGESSLSTGDEVALEGNKPAHGSSSRRSSSSSNNSDRNNNNSSSSSSSGLTSAKAPSHREWILDPSPMDIICGRGSRVSHPGNQRFRNLVLERRDLYQQAKKREEKTRITMEIVHLLQEGPTPSRFLLKDASSDQWYDVGLEYAKEKISHALRSRPNEERRKKQGNHRGGGSSRSNLLSSSSNSSHNSAGGGSDGGSGDEAGGSHKKRGGRKSQCPPYLEKTVQKLIRDQQALLGSLIRQELIPLIHVPTASELSASVVAPAVAKIGTASVQ